MSDTYRPVRVIIALILGEMMMGGPYSLSENKMMDWETTRAAAICGSWVAVGYICQTLGLLTTTASRSCVIGSLHCVFVATIAEIWRVQR
jgi:hypothetical protein